MKDSFKRQLVAILYADVAGYSRLTAADEEGTHRALSRTLDTLTDSVANHDGRVVHFAGDAVLAKFDTITAALTCAVEVQHQLGDMNAQVEESKRVQVRIGVNLGDVIMDRDDIYGNGVNVAVRIQELARPGGICVSDNVRDAVGRNLPVGYEYMGETRVKNIDRPIRTFRVITGSAHIVEKPAMIASKPSIAVLPFEYFGVDDAGMSDGITEDVIRALSCFRGLSVAAHHSSFLYKDPVKVQDVGRDLQVQYVLEGTIRKAGSRVRITAQLIETESGKHMWSESYDRREQDILDLQAEIASTICMTLAGRLRVATQRRAMSKTMDRLTTYDYVLKGQALSGDDAGKNRQAQAAFGHAIELDPACARAYTGLAVSRLSDFLNDWSNDACGAQLEAAGACARSAIEYDDSDNKPYWVLAEIQMLCGDSESARWHLDKAAALNPYDTDVYAAAGTILSYVPEAAQAVEKLTTAISRNPYHPVWYLWSLGFSLYMADDFEGAASALRQAVERKPQFFTPYQHLVAVYAHLGEFEHARKAAGDVVKHNPGFGRDTVCARHPFQHEDDRDRYLEALRRGGSEIWPDF